MKHIKKLAISAFAALSLGLAACGGGGNGTGDASGSAAADGGSGELQTVTVGALPITTTALLHLGTQQGIFEKYGLEIKLESGQGGPALLPAVVSGTQNFGTASPVPLLTARERGMDVRVVASYTYDTPEGVHAILVNKDSGIKSAKDLEGKTVAINTLQSIGDLLIMEAVAKDGGDPSKVEFVEMGFPSMEAAIQGGQVDAVWTPEPFLTIIKDAGYEVISYPGVEAVEGHPTLLFFTSGQQVEKDPEMVENMQAAINEAMDYATEHEQEMRDIAAKEFKMDQALADRVVIEDLGGPVRRDTIEKAGELMVKYGFIDKDPDVDGLLQNVEGN